MKTANCARFRELKRVHVIFQSGLAKQVTRLQSVVCINHISQLTKQLLGSLTDGLSSPSCQYSVWLTFKKSQLQMRKGFHETSMLHETLENRIYTSLHALKTRIYVGVGHFFNISPLSHEKEILSCHFPKLDGDHPTFPNISGSMTVYKDQNHPIYFFVMAPSPT